MKIHFVCRGNVFRSKLAEAYLNSLQHQFQVSSSGVEAAARDRFSPITAKLLELHSLGDFVAQDWQQTTPLLLDEQDLIVFMRGSHYDYTRDVLDYNPKNYQAWGIRDLTMQTPVEKKMFVAEKTLGQIKKHVDGLVDSFHD